MPKVVQLHPPKPDPTLDELNAEVVAKYDAFKAASRVWTEVVFRRAAYIAMKAKREQLRAAEDKPEPPSVA